MSPSDNRRWVRLNFLNRAARFPDPDRDLLAHAATALRQLLGFDVSCIYLSDPDHDTLTLVAGSGLTEALEVQHQEPSESLAYRVLAERSTIVYEDLAAERIGPHSYESFLGTPVFDDDVPVGVVVLVSRARRRVPATEVEAFETMAHSVGIVLRRMQRSSISRLAALLARGDPLPTFDDVTATITRDIDRGLWIWASETEDEDQDDVLWSVAGTSWQDTTEALSKVAERIDELTRLFDAEKNDGIR